MTLPTERWSIPGFMNWKRLRFLYPGQLMVLRDLANDRRDFRHFRDKVNLAEHVHRKMVGG